MVTITEIQDQATKEKRAERNLRRRTAYHDKLLSKRSSESHAASHEELIAHAKKQCTTMLADAEQLRQYTLANANHKAAELLRDAKQQCDKLKAEAISQARSHASENLHTVQCRIERALADGKYKLDCLHVSISGAEARLQTLNRQETAQLDLVARRTRDAARKRSRYWEDRRAISTTPDIEIAPNRKRSCVNGLVSRVIRVLLTEMKGFNLGARKLVMKRFWLHTALKDYQPATLGCPRLDASVSTAVSDMIKSLQIVKFARRKDHLATKRALLTALVGQSTVAQRNQTSLANALGVRRQNLHKASTVRRQLDEDISVRYPSGERKQRSDKISAEVRKIVEGYWEANTRISPCKKDIARFRTGVKQYEKHTKHWLEETEVEFFIKFQNWCTLEGNGVSIGLRSFQHLKPYYIRTMKDRNVCCCKAHVEMDLFKEALNKFRRHSHPTDCVCDCSICSPEHHRAEGGPCVASKMSITSVRQWMEEAVCPKPEGQEWHQRSCIFGLCDNCGVHKLAWCKREMDEVETLSIDWDAFEYVELDDNAQMRREKKRGMAESAQKKVKRLRMVHKQTSLPDFKEQVLSKMGSFLIHNFRSRWQADQFKLCLKSFPKGTIVSSIDFSENYTFKCQNEVQTLHWDNRQITLLIHVTYRHREDSSSLEGAVGQSVRMAQDSTGDRDIIADYHFYISDDNAHDTLFVQHCMDLHARWMQDEGIHFQQHWVWSDGAASQFKSCRPFYYVSRYYNRHGARMKWFFHASGHGKGVADALGGHIKSGLEKEQLKGIHGARLENASDAVAFCREKFALGLEKEYGDVLMVRRMFWEIGVDEVNRRKRWDCDVVKGSRSLHCFDGFSKDLSTLLQVRELACFCVHCVDDEPAKCENIEWAGSFRLEMIKGVLPADVRFEIESIGVGEGGSQWEDGSLAELVKLGDFYAVEAERPNDWDADFYVLQCEAVLHEVEDSFTDGYNVEFAEGDLVLKGRWFQPVPRLQGRFVYNDAAPPSFTHAKSVIHIRFAMMPCAVSRNRKDGARMYSLDADIIAAISASCTTERFL